MKEFPADLLASARHIIWFEPPKQALKFPNNFLCYVMQYGRIDDILTVQRYYSDDAFKAALTYPSPGIMDARSWAFWNLKYFNDPNKPMPKRKL